MLAQTGCSGIVVVAATTVRVVLHYYKNNMAEAIWWHTMSFVLCCANAQEIYFCNTPFPASPLN